MASRKVSELTAHAEGFTLPKDVILPPKSQVGQYADAVTQRIEQFDQIAARLGAGFGISFTFEMNPMKVPNASDVGAQVVLALMVAVAHRAERVTLERRDQVWGLYFSREPSPVQTGERRHVVPLREAPLDVRERFLAASERFFREYLALCAQRLGTLKGAVTAADKTLAMLRSVQLE